DTQCDKDNVAKSTCSSGKCIVTDCDNGFEDCDKLPANGCEVNIDGDGANCTPVCGAGKCGFNCNGTFDDCDGDLATGCETDTASSEANCGACKKVCAPKDGTGVCAGGMCTIGSCNGTFADCNKNPADGCEV